MGLLEKRNQLLEKEIKLEQKEIQEEKSQEVPQMSIGQQLEIMSKVKEIEYQNSLVMMSLEKYNEKYEALKKEQTELLETIYQKTKSLEDSNQLLKQSMSQQLQNVSKIIDQSVSQLCEKCLQEVGNVSEKSQSIISDHESRIESIYKSNIELITKETADTVLKCQEIQKDSQRRSESYYNRKQIIDYLIYANLAITPILLVILSYVIFIKK